MAECLQVGEQLATGRSGKGGRQETQSKKQQLWNDFIVKKKTKWFRWLANGRVLNYQSSSRDSGQLSQFAFWVFRSHQRVISSR